MKERELIHLILKYGTQKYHEGLTLSKVYEKISNKIFKKIESEIEKLYDNQKEEQII